MMIFLRILFYVVCVRQQVLISYLLYVFNNTIIYEKNGFRWGFNSNTKLKGDCGNIFQTELQSCSFCFLKHFWVYYGFTSNLYYLDMCLSFSHYHISTSATEFLVTAMDVIYVSMYFQWNFLSYSLSQISTLLDNIRCSTEKFTNAMDTTNQTRGELIVVRAKGSCNNQK